VIIQELQSLLSQRNHSDETIAKLLKERDALTMQVKSLLAEKKQLNGTMFVQNYNML